MPTQKRLEKIKQVSRARQNGLTIVLEDIHDPHNAEAILRTADAFGVQEVSFIFEKEKPYDPKKIGKASSSSANKWLDFHIFLSTKDCISQLKQRKFKIIATVLDGAATSIYEADLSENSLAILVGNENRGLSKTAIDMANRKLFIPMRGMVQSLNVSVTTAICLFEITRQRSKNPKQFTLAKHEQERLIENFSKRTS